MPFRYSLVTVRYKDVQNVRTNQVGLRYTGQIVTIEVDETTPRVYNQATI